MSNFAKARKEAKKTEKAMEKAHEERLEKCVPVAREILKLVLSKVDSYPMGDKAQDSQENDDLSKEVLQLMLDHNIRWVDRQFVLQLALQPMSFVKDVIDTALGRTWEVTLTGLFKKKVSDLTLADVETCLRSGEPLEAEPDVIKHK